MTAVPNRKAIRAGLKAAGLVPRTGDNPDAELVRLIAACRAARDERDRTYALFNAARRSEVAEGEFRRASAHWIALQDRVACTRAMSAEGALAKLLLAIEDISGAVPGTVNHLPLCAMRDAIEVGVG